MVKKINTVLDIHFVFLIIFRVLSLLFHQFEFSSNIIIHYSNEQSSLFNASLTALKFSSNFGIVYHFVGNRSNNTNCFSDNNHTSRFFIFQTMTMSFQIQAIKLSQY